MSNLTESSRPTKQPSNGSNPGISERPSVGFKKIILFLLGIAISGVLIFYLFKDLDIEKFKREFTGLNIWYFIPLTALLTLIMGIRALRSRYLFPPIQREKAGFLPLLEAVLVGFTANSFLPMRAGEIIRPLYLQNRVGLPFTTALASIFTERIFDLLALLTIAPILLSQISNPPEFLFTATAALRTISAIGLFGIFLCAFFGNFTTKVASLIVPKILPKKVSDLLLLLLNQVVDTIGAVKSPKDLLFILVYSFGLWTVTGFYFQLCGRMFGEDLPYFAGILVAVSVAFAVAAPSSPGFIGTFQFGCTLALSNVLHFTQEFALAYGLVVHAVQTVSQLLITVIALTLSGGRGARAMLWQYK